MKKFNERFSKYYDEIKWLYCELYEKRMDMFFDLCEQLEFWYENRNNTLKKLDEYRVINPDWYKENQMLGMMLYVNAFGGDLKGVRQKLDYIEECGVNYLHLMPLLESPEGRSDGGYAVSDYRKVKSELGTMEDLNKLCEECHTRNISICLDFVMNHTSEDHEWAMKAKAGEKEYQDRYYFYDNYDIPSWFEETVPQVFPVTAPGNFSFNEETGKYVMTTFYPYQWDLNYSNPVVLNQMIYNMLFLANCGVDVIRIDAVPYIWKQVGTNCRNLPQVHNIVRIMRIVCEIVCPGVVLLGEVVMEPDKVIPYFGSTEKPECHMLYNVTTMATTWHTVATKDISLLRKQMDVVTSLPNQYVFLNYLRCHDDIGWGLDYQYLERLGMREVPHKKFLNDYLTGNYPRSFARGELYNSDPRLGDARLCGTTASLCGVEKARCENDKVALDMAIQYHLTLHGYMLTQSGIPVIYSGDEMAQENDYSYHEDDMKKADSRYLHRGDFSWELEKKRMDNESIQGRVFNGIKQLTNIRKKYDVFNFDAEVRTLDMQDKSILGIVRIREYEELVALFNFSDQMKKIWLDELECWKCVDLITKNVVDDRLICLKPFSMKWLWRDKRN